MGQLVEYFIMKRILIGIIFLTGQALGVYGSESDASNTKEIFINFYYSSEAKAITPYMRNKADRWLSNLNKALKNSRVPLTASKCELLEAFTDSDKDDFISNAAKTADINVYLHDQFIDAEIGTADTAVPYISLSAIDFDSIKYFGQVFNLDSGLDTGSFCTVMADCGNKINYFSNRNVMYNGVATGDGSSDNAATLASFKDQLTGTCTATTKDCHITSVQPILRRMKFKFRVMEASECQAWCAANAKCEYWVFKDARRARGRSCHLYKEDYKRAKGLKSGKKNC